MQQEDDLRALAKIMEFGRAVSIFILVVHVYVYCYPSMSAWHLNLDVIDRILMNFDRTTGIFGCILWTKLMAVLLLAISCMGTIGVKGEKITWQRIWAVLTAGAVLFFMNWWLLDLPFPHEAMDAKERHGNDCTYFMKVENQKSADYVSRVFLYKLADEVVIYLLPISYKSGINITGRIQPGQWVLHESKTFRNNVCRLIYRLKK